MHIMMDINEHQDQRCTWGDNVGRDLYLLGVNALVSSSLLRFYDIFVLCFCLSSSAVLHFVLQ